MKPNTSRCFSVSSRIAPPLWCRLPYSTGVEERKQKKLHRLPGLTNRARDQPLLARLRDGLHIDAVDLRNATDPGAVAAVEQPRATLRAIGLAKLDRRLRRDCRRDVARLGRDGLGFRRQRCGRGLDGGRGFGRVRRRRVGLVELKVRFHRGSKLVAGAAELAQRATHHASQLRQLRRPEDQQGEDPDDQHLLESNVEHGARVTRAEPPSPRARTRKRIPLQRWTGERAACREPRSCPAHAHEARELLPPFARRRPIDGPARPALLRVAIRTYPARAARVAQDAMTSFCFSGSVSWTTRPHCTIL